MPGHTLLFFCIFFTFLPKDTVSVIFCGQTGILYMISTDSGNENRDGGEGNTDSGKGNADNRELLVYTNLYSDILGKM